MTKKKQEVQLPLFEPSTLIYIDPQIDEQATPTLKQAIDEQATTRIRSAAFHPSTIFSRLVESQAVGKYNKANPLYQEISVANTPVTLTMVRMEVFCSNQACVECGIEGNVFLAERHVNDECEKQYLNLYSVSNRGTVMLTVDHMLPEAFGGKFHFDNLQVMCQPCNMKKADKLSNDQIAILLQDLSKHTKVWVDQEFMHWLLKLYAEYNDEKDSVRKHRLHGMLSRYRKRINHTTKAMQYEEMTKNIKEVLIPVVPTKPSLPARIFAAIGRRLQYIFRPVVKARV